MDRLRDLERLLCDETAEPKALPLSLLEEITDGFSDKQQIGKGGFAKVYKGILENRVVAVKRMSDANMDEKVFQQEVECLMLVKHRNVVRFLGYCADKQGNMERHNRKFIMADVNQRLLCFEYLPKGSLDKYITDTSRGLRWRDRYQIIMGICKGLNYLHHKNIVHLDLKPANILLDDNFVPKITDFGISRCFDEMQSRVITKIGGTPGYLAPESFNHTEVTYRHSYRLDIYSLGVVIIEILTGKKGYHRVDNVVESWSKMLDKYPSDIQLKQVQVCAQIGIDCINSNPAKRPDTQHIISMLNEYIETDLPTSQPVVESSSKMLEKSQSDIRLIDCINPSQLKRPDALHNISILNKHINTDLPTSQPTLMSYQRLNPDIRRCIEYCSIFPRGSKLRMDDLVRLWIAQGFVNTSCATEDMEDVAQRYIQELVAHSLLQPSRTISDADCLTVHGFLHPVLDKVTVNCFRIENERIHRGEVWKGDVPRDVQHLFLQKYDAELITAKILGLESLVTLIVYVVEDDTLVEEKIIEMICKRLLNLRVLAIAFSEEHPIKQHNKFCVAESISQLKHLRYLAIRTSQYCKVILPCTINSLQHIQLLDFGHGYTVDFNFGDHINLRYILCGLEEELPNIGTLISLQTIRRFTIRNKQGYEVKQLRNLNKLRGCLDIRGLEIVRSKEEALEANLAAKERLTELILMWDNASTADRCSPEVEAEVLEGISPPAGLEKLEISNYEGSRYPDWMLGKQNYGLQTLAFWHCRQLGPAPQLVEAFPHLRVLKLWYCSWDTLPDNMEHLASLKELKVVRCLNIMSLPKLPLSLVAFTLSYCNVEFIKSCQTAGHSNWQKIEHVPNKSFR